VSLPRFQVVPAAYLLLTRPAERGTAVLLQLRGAGASYMPHHWASGAAGHVEYGESVAVAAAREAEEELGIQLATEDLRPLCALQRTEPGNPDPIEQRVDFFLTASRWVGEPTVREPAKCERLGWFTLDELPSPVVPHEEHVLRLVASGDLPPVLSLGF
jgi:8-oxo-dGTP pyrophosphatase MutT (NUDIX family)